ncbi:MAG: class I SAM-dependent methyltransferase, partial [Gemmatimonadales bacterium]
LGRRKGDLAAVGADALELPFGAESFDGVTVGFGVRNLASLESGLREIRRVLKFGGRVVILEFAKPRLLPLRAAYMFYFRRVLPGVGRLISRHKDAYNYLPDSVLSFPEPHGLERMMSDCGFDLVGHRLLTGGIAALHWGVKA